MDAPPSRSATTGSAPPGHGAAPGSLPVLPARSPAVHACGGARVRVPPPASFLGAIGVGALLHRVAPAPVPLPRVAARAAGAALGAASLALGLGALREFRRTRQNPVPWTEKTEMLEAGPFRFSRNPMYVGMAGCAVAAGLAMRNGWILGLAPLAAAVVHLTAVLPEEAFLEERFGASYAAYRARVPRYLGF